MPTAGPRAGRELAAGSASRRRAGTASPGGRRSGGRASSATTSGPTRSARPAKSRAAQVLEVGDHRVGVERAAVVEAHARAQGERPGARGPRGPGGGEHAPRAGCRRCGSGRAARRRSTRWPRRPGRSRGAGRARPGRRGVPTTSVSAGGAEDGGGERRRAPRRWPASAAPRGTGPSSGGRRAGSPAPPAARVGGGVDEAAVAGVHPHVGEILRAEEEQVARLQVGLLDRDRAAGRSSGDAGVAQQVDPVHGGRRGS